MMIMARRSRLNRKSKPVRNRLVKIGVVGVDSGQVVITDPAYIGSSLPSYEKISSISLANKNQLKNKLGIKVAVVSETGMGDGVYPVYAVKGKVKGLPEAGERVKSLIVKFEE